jgi:DNA-binding protein YbaB
VSAVALTISLLADEEYVEQIFVDATNVAMLQVESAEHELTQSTRFEFGVELICDVLGLLTACAFLIL